MRIDSAVFAGTLKQLDGVGEPATEAPGFAVNKDAPVQTAVSAVPVAPTPPTAEVPSTSGLELVGQAVPGPSPLPVSADGAGQSMPGGGEAGADSAAAPSAGAPTVPSASTLPLWTRRSRDALQPSPARKPNRHRAAMVALGLFLIGIVLGPWLSQRAVPQPPAPPAGHQAVHAIADTLKASALGLPVPAMPEASSYPSATAEQAAAKLPVGAVAPNVTVAAALPTGEERYLGMLAAMKGAAPASGEAAIQLLPRSEVPQGPGSKVGRTGAATVQADAYPAEPIPLELERESRARDSAAAPTRPASASPLAIAPEGAATGRYLVLRIETDAHGRVVALMAPLGANERTQAGWTRVGDATADGFTVEAISPRHVLLRSPTGRVQVLTPQEAM